MTELDDRTIRNIMKKDVEISKSFYDVIDKFKNEEKGNKKKWVINLKFKVAVLIIAILLPISLPVIANTSNFLKNKFANDNLGVQKAIENNYIKNIDMEYVKSSGINIRAESIIMDNSNLNILLDYSFDNTMPDINNIFISDLNVEDENSNKIYTINNEKEFLAKTVDWYRVESLDKNNAKQSLIFLSNNKFPNSKKLYVSFSKIEISSNLQKKVVYGKWNFIIDLPEEFYNRTNIIFTQKCENEIFKILKTELSSTSLYLEVETSMLDNYDRKYLALKENINLKDELGNNYEVGRTFEIDNSLGKTILKFSFENITKYDKFEKLILSFKYDDKIEYIILEK